MLKAITPIVLTFNEEANIQRTLKALTWANEVLVVDSFSNDATLFICQQFKNVRLIQREFDTSAHQCNFALSQDIKTEWVLSMDADYVLSPELIVELEGLQAPPTLHGYRINFDYLIGGKKLRRSLYPPRTALYRRKYARYLQDGHTQRVIIQGEVGKLSAKIQHDDRKPYARWLNSQKSYAKQEAIKLRESPWSTLSLQNKLRKLGIAPLAILPYTLFFKALILDGSPGLQYTRQRFVAEICLQSARLKLF